MVRLLLEVEKFGTLYELGNAQARFDRDHGLVGKELPNCLPWTSSVFRDAYCAVVKRYPEYRNHLETKVVGTTGDGESTNGEHGEHRSSTDSGKGDPFDVPFLDLGNQAALAIE